jgi:hypothetical protein
MHFLILLLRGKEEGRCTVPCVRDFRGIFEARWIEGE